MNTALAHSARSPLPSTKRIHNALTASAERRLLRWIAERLPSAITSDRLTALGLAAQIVAGVCFALARTHRMALVGVIAAVVLNWFGDSLDGTVARVRGQERPRFGFYVDHVVDILGALALMSGLALSGFVHPAIAAAMLVTFLLLSAESYLAVHTLGRFELSQGPFGPTEIRILLALGVIALLRSPYAHLFGRRFLLFDIGGVIASAAMFVILVAVSIRHTAQLFREEPIR
jgi:archaetidylinositol phosphate synthase